MIHVTDNGLDIVKVREKGERCDGCWKKMSVSTFMLTGIESCCGGGCSRQLCQECVIKAARMIQEMLR